MHNRASRTIMDISQHASSVFYASWPRTIKRPQHHPGQKISLKNMFHKSCFCGISWLVQKEGFGTTPSHKAGSTAATKIKTTFRLGKCSWIFPRSFNPWKNHRIKSSDAMHPPVFVIRPEKRKEKRIAFSLQCLVTFPPVFGPYKSGLCFALCLAQVWIHTNFEPLWSRFCLNLHFSYLTTRFSSIILFISFVHSPQTMPSAEIRPAFLLNCESHQVRRKVILFILFAPIQLSISCINEELLPWLKPSDSKRQNLDFESPPQTSLDALRSICEDAVQLVDKNMQPMIKSFLHMPDNEAYAPAWWKYAVHFRK